MTDVGISSKTPNAVHASVAISVALAVLAASTASLFSGSPMLESLESRLGLNSSRLPLPTLTDDLLRDIQSNGDARADKVIVDFVARHSPGENAAVAAFLFSRKDTQSDAALAEKILETAAVRYSDGRLYLTLANHYLSGKSLAKDFAKAKAILEMKILAENRLAHYYMGNLWSDEANPDRDLAKAGLNYKISAEKGYQPARTALSQLAAKP